MLFFKCILNLVLVMLVNARFTSDDRPGTVKIWPDEKLIISKTRWTRNAAENKEISCKQDNAFQSVPNKCDYFIECKEHKALQTQCPDGLHYDATITFPNFPCNYPSLVDCQSQSNTEPSSATNISNDKKGLIKCQHENGFQAVPNKCNFYIDCQNNSPQQIKCHDGLYFDDKISYPNYPCNFPSNVDSRKQSHADDKPSTPSTPTAVNPTERINTMLPKKESKKDDLNRSQVCKTPNMYLKVAGKCDSYTECRGYKAVEMQCPDGLHFDAKVSWPSYPCEYPQNVQCASGDEPQQAVATDECPHQYAFLAPTAALENDCGHYQMCVGGKAVDMYCPKGLAFDVERAVCDWPSDVSSCNTEAYLGFTCPTATFDGGFPIITNHKYADDCFAFYSCVNGHARILSCDPGFAFNPATARCEDESILNCYKENKST